MTREVYRRARYSGKVSGDLVYNFAETIEKLREVGATDVTDGVMVLVREINSIFAYHADSEAPDDGANIIKPHLVDVGRWLKISFAGQHAPGKGFADKWIDVTRIQPAEEVIVNKALAGDWPQEVVREQIEVDGLLDVQDGYVLVGQAHVHPGGGGGAGPAGPAGPAGADIVSLSLEENNTLTLTTDNGQFQADLSSLEGEGVAINVPNGTRSGQILVWEEGLNELTVALASAFGGGADAELGLTEVLAASEARIADTRAAQSRVTIADGAASFIISYAPPTTDDLVERLKRFYSPSLPYTSFGNFYFLYQETGDEQNPKVLVTNGTENSPDKLTIDREEIDPLEIIISPTNPPTVDEVVAAINAVANQDDTKPTYTAETLAGGDQAWDTNRDSSLADSAPLFEGNALAMATNTENKWLVGDRRLENYVNKYIDWFAGDLEGTFVSTERKPRAWDRSYNIDGVREVIRFSPFILEPTTYGNSAGGQPNQYTYLEIRRTSELGADNPLTLEFVDADIEGVNLEGGQLASQWFDNEKTIKLFIKPDVTTVGDIGQHFLDEQQAGNADLATFFSAYEVVVYVAEIGADGGLLDRRNIEGPGEIIGSDYDWIFDGDGFTYADGEIVDWHDKSITSSTYPFGIAEVKSGLANGFAANDSNYFADGKQVRNVANAYLQAYYSEQDVSGLPLGYTGWRTLTPWAPNLRLYWMGHPFNVWAFVDNDQSSDTLNPIINITQNVGGGAGGAGESVDFSTQYDGAHDIQESRNPNNPVFTAMTVDSGLSYIGGEYITIQSDANPEYVQVGIVVDYVDNGDGTGSLTYDHVTATGGDPGYSGNEIWNINLSGAPGLQQLGALQTAVLDALSNTFDAVDDAIDSNSSDISDNTASIGTNAAGVSNNDTLIQSNAADIAVAQETATGADQIASAAFANLRVVDVDVTVANGQFVIDGHEYSAATGFELARGLKYRFVQSDASNANHPIRFSTVADGTHGGGVEFQDGVTTTGVAGDEDSGTSVTLETEFSAQPRKLYYYCANHPGMGSVIVFNVAAELANLENSIDERIAVDDAQQNQIDNLQAAAGLTNPLVTDLDVGDWSIKSTATRDLTLQSDSGTVNIEFTRDPKVLQVDGEVRAFEYAYGMGASNFGIPKYGLNEINDTLFRADQRFGNDASVLGIHHGYSNAEGTQVFYDGTSSGWYPGGNSFPGNEVTEENKVPLTDTTDWRPRTIYYSNGNGDSVVDMSFDDSGYTGDRSKIIQYRIRIEDEATYDEDGQLLTPDTWSWAKYEIGRDAETGTKTAITSAGIGAGFEITAGDQATTVDGIIINFTNTTGHKDAVYWNIHPRTNALPFHLYDGDNESRLDLEPGEAHTFVTVLSDFQDFTTTGVSYPQGSMFLCFYFNWTNFSSIQAWGLHSGRYHTDRGIWKEWGIEALDYTDDRNISKNVSGRYAVMRMKCPPTAGSNVNARLYMRAIKLEITAALPRQDWLDGGHTHAALPFDQSQAANSAWDSQITSLITVNMHFDRMYATVTETAYVDKYRPTNTMTGRLLFPDRYRRQGAYHVDSMPPIAFTSNRLAGLSYDSSSDTLIVEHTNHNALEINSSGMITRIGPASPNVGDILTWDGGSWAPAAAGAANVVAEPSFTTKQVNFDCDAGSRYLVNTDNGAVTALLPLNPAQGDAVYFVDATGNFDTNSLTIDRNTHSIMGLDEDMTVTVSGESFGLVYTGSDWRIYR